MSEKEMNNYMFDAKYRAQAKYCREKSIPHFAPMNCFGCGSYVYAYYSLDHCGKHLITGCKKCCKSFVD